MFFLLVGLVLFSFLRVSSISAHDPFVLDARRAAPGSIQLELEELALARVSNTKSYRLNARGVPRHVVFGLFTKDFSHSFHEVASGFQLDESDSIVSPNLGGMPQRLDQLTFQPGSYPRGAAWEVAFVSADRAWRAFGKVIPHPISAHDGNCTISLELVSQRGDRFIASGSGFAPGEDVITESRYSGRVIQERKKASADGLLPFDTLSHGGRGDDHAARYIVKGRFCEVGVDYDWGTAALIRR